MARPSWFTLQASAIRIASRLTADNLSADYDTDEDVETEIDGLIDKQAGVALGRVRKTALELGLVTRMDDDLSTLLTAEQKDRVQTAAELLVIAAIRKTIRGADQDGKAAFMEDGRGENIVLIGAPRFASAEGILNDVVAELQAYAKSLAGQAANNGQGAALVVNVERDDECGHRGHRRRHCSEFD